MKKLFFFLLLMNGFYSLYSQISVPGTPESFMLKTKAAMVLPEKILDSVDIARYLTEDSEKGIQNRYGVVQQLNVDIKTSGVKTEIAGKGYIWQYRIQSPQTFSIGITFKNYLLPEGSGVFIYNETHTRLIGAFTSKNNNERQNLTIAEFKGNHAIIEYFEPYNPAFEGELTIGSVSQAYRDIQEASATGRVGINCPAGANWQDAKHAVCRMTFHDSPYSTILCTGFLVNNTREDGTPYFQTANHCLTTNSQAATLVTYFNFENTSCNSTDADSLITLSGATVLATNAYSDFTLLKLTENPPVIYLPLYAGWDASGGNASNGTCIHHPGGRPKCIAIDNNPPVSYDGTISWSEEGSTTTSTTAPNTHWEVKFDVGGTEGGSSGSPLFDENQRVIGQLHGGDNTSQFFGKFSLSWNNSATITSQLKHWLDPDNTGTLKMDGTYMNIKPIAAFSTNFTNVCVNSSVTLSDKSKFLPTSWEWSITPLGYKFINGTSAASKNPQVEFTNPANYTVSLIVTNASGADSITRTNYIVAGNLKVALSGIPSDSIICGYNLSNYVLTGSGAENYTFTLERTDKIDYYVDADSINLSLKSSEKKNGSFNTWIKVTGTQSTCQSTDSALLKIDMPANDDIQNAITLLPGRNIAYSNFCGSIQSNEPSPPLNNCTSSDSWCSDGYTLQHTMWFKFLGPTSGKITIDTHGFNDRIAVYEADSYDNIMSGNPSNYSLLNANDDRSSTDNTALLTDMPVEPQKFYWLQVDGFQGATGNCVIDLISNSLDLFPNPTSGILNVYISNTEDGNANVEIFSTIGKLVYSNDFNVTTTSNHLSCDLSSLSSGLYVIKVTINGTTIKKKFMICKT